MNYSITPARFPDDHVHVARLFREYGRHLQVNLQFQCFEDEVITLPGRYAPPKGNILLAWQQNALSGCVCWYEMEPGIGEIKRLFVRPEKHGSGLGRALLTHALEELRTLGYAKVRLDSLERLEAAKKLYVSLGFRPIAAYNANPEPDVYYMELDL